MNTFASPVREAGRFHFPPFAGRRIMMMPLDFDNLDESLPPELTDWKEGICRLVGSAGFHRVGYITIDEKVVQAGHTQRRPGLHVDGVGEFAGNGAYGGSYATNGMITASSLVGCRAWNKTFEGSPLENGDCQHLFDQCPDSEAIYLQPDKAYILGSHAVHEGVPLERTHARQFLRISGYSSAPWHEGYTVNPTGTLPSGPISGPRPKAFMQGKNH